MAVMMCGNDRHNGTVEMGTWGKRRSRENPKAADLQAHFESSPGRASLSVGVTSMHDQDLPPCSSGLNGFIPTKGTVNPLYPNKAFFQMRDRHFSKVRG
eukprot:scaffold11662_cov117-Cylindrotheca_fusiformis.AAC.4